MPFAFYSLFYLSCLNLTHTLNGLNCGTSYTLYVWSYNSCGNSSFVPLVQSTSSCFTCGLSTISDIDGNSYGTINIGAQCWMQENLKTTQYRNGIAIPNIAIDGSWATDATGAYSCYDNNCGNYNTTYGKLYNWY